ncbi:MAG: response regulator receiver [bacterium]|nr:MAG: response regulator receiver [bacterium]
MRAASARGNAVSEVPDLRVLIVEDQALLAMELELVLSESGCEVVGCAMDTAGALGLAELRRPDLALVDINLLDGMTGPDIARHLIREYGTAVVFLTANPEQIPDGFAGALGAVSKPFDEATIRGVVDFARQFIRNGASGETPRRFSPAPWLATAPNGIAPR